MRSTGDLSPALEEAYLLALADSWDYVKVDRASLAKMSTLRLWQAALGLVEGSSAARESKKRTLARLRQVHNRYLGKIGSGRAVGDLPALAWRVWLITRRAGRLRLVSPDPLIADNRQRLAETLRSDGRVTFRCTDAAKRHRRLCAAHLPECECGVYFFADVEAALAFVKHFAVFTASQRVERVAVRPVLTLGRPGGRVSSVCPDVVPAEWRAERLEVLAVFVPRFRRHRDPVATALAAELRHTYPVPVQTLDFSWISTLYQLK